jgi:hypothetical protein
MLRVWGGVEPSLVHSAGGSDARKPRQEKTALRHLAKGEVHEVPVRLMERLQALGLADGSPEGHLTDAGLELYRTSPREAGRRK